MSYRWWSSCRTNAGRQRPINEDAFLELDDIGLWVVADGMGGHARGDVAARMVVEAFEDLPYPHSIDEYVSLVRARLQRANQRIQEESQRGGSDLLMGCTVVAVLVYKRQWACLWAGDSRAYLLRDGRLHQLTRDHSIAQEMLQRGELTAAEAAVHPYANRITRAVGARPELVLDESRSTLRDGDAILLCTDGLTKELSDQEITAVLETLDCEAASRELIDLSLERGARDNVTVAVIRFEANTGFGDPASEDTTLTEANDDPAPHRWQRPVAVVGPVAPAFDPGRR